MTRTNPTQVRNQQRSGSKSFVKALVFSGILIGVGTLGGCRDGGEGLVTGAALGALTGLAIGSLDGNAGQGAALGAAIGGVGGAIIGNENRRDREYRSYGNRRDRGYRSSHPYCSTHRVYHSHGRAGYGHHDHYEYDEWWND